jgi:hypothetical protein
MKTKNKIKELRLELEKQAETIERLFKCVVHLKTRFNDFVIEHEDRKSAVEIPNNFIHPEVSFTVYGKPSGNTKQELPDFFKD